MLQVLVVIARLLVAAVFAFAGSAKMTDLAGSRRAVASFGVPAGIAAVLGTLLPFIELVVAAALLPSSTAAYGAAAALVLLLMFIGAIAVSLARGQAPDCQCFGQLHSRPVGRGVLVRNIALAALAAFALAAESVNPGPSFVAWLRGLRGFELAVVVGGAAALVLLSVQVVMLARLLGEGGRQASRLELAASLAIGAIAPPFSLFDLAGRRSTLGTLRASGNPLVLVFSDPACRPCVTLWPAIASWQRDHANALTLVVISRGRADVNRQKADEHGVTGILLQRDREVALAYGVRGTPAAIAVDRAGLIASLPVQSEVGIRSLVEDVARAAGGTALPAPVAEKPASSDRTGRSPIEVGDDVPPFTLEGLDGMPFTLSSLQGTPTVLVFWRPSCSFCRRMTDEFLECIARADPARARVVVMSSGTPEENQTLAAHVPVVLDPASAIGREFGVRGTPSAVVVGADGTLVAAPVSGRTQVLSMLNRATAMPLEGSSRPIRQDGFDDELLADGGLLLYREAKGRVLTLNPTAALVWEYCDGEHTVDEIVAEVRSVFPSSTDADADVRQLIASLVEDNAVSLAVRVQ